MSNAKDKFLAHLAGALRDGSLVKLTLGGPRGRDRSLRQLLVRRVELREGAHLSFVWRHTTRDVTKNFTVDDGLALLGDVVGTDFRAAHLFTTRLAAQLEFREGRAARLVERPATHAAAPPGKHDIAKVRRVTSVGSPWLRALGIATPDGRIAKGMEAKFRQINKFVEVLEHLLRSESKIRNPKSDLTLVDMGCGKGYLTFAAYDWLRNAGWPNARVRGIEARVELVGLCNRIATENGLTGLSFEAGSIATAKLDDVDVLIALHACDTATDDAIARGIAAGARLIVLSPCCHKELRPQLQPPPALAGALRHGILRERQSEFVTDALRAALLEWAGYETKVFEFISTEHTAKNLMIAATKSRHTGRAELAVQARELARCYGIRSQHLAAQLNFDLTAP